MFPRTQARRCFTDQPLRVGDRYTVDGAGEYVVTAVTKSTQFGPQQVGWVEDSELVA